MKKILTLLLFFPALMSAQPVLLPHIGLSSMPQLTDPICSIPVYTGEMDTSGFDEGDLVPDFTLYKTNGDSVRLSDALSLGLPVLLVGGNYTCPVFREKISALNDMANYYAGQLNVYIIYGVEAHPIVDPSPYSGFVWVTAENNAEGVLYQQPDTYGERVTLIDSLRANYTIVPEILVDGPCNDWWLNFGPAPNNAYLIDTNGIVKAKHGWFHRTPENMWCDIDSLLGTSSGNCVISANNGTFSWTLATGDSTAYGNPGDVISVHGVLQNLSLTDNAVINISKQFIDLPSGWASALCGDICYSSTVTSTDITLPPGDDLNFVFYFYTGVTADSGYVKVRFKNLNVAGNTINQRYFGITTLPAGVQENAEEIIRLFPNPVQETLILANDAKLLGRIYNITDPLGRTVLTGKINDERIEIEMGELPDGMYILKIDQTAIVKKIIKN
ncbi:MAG: T9SS type A sorting domain-containing protein [Bacteroidota bacterium]|nr:T9SS type A sorting domain-containing protein [Bacteroidota bacterium]